MSYHLYLSLPFILFLLPAISSDLSADRAALLRLSSALQGRTLFWDATSPTPCSWKGVTCDNTTNRVTELRLPGHGLSGQIPLYSIGNLTQLRTLSLRHNSLTGSLPADIGSCVELRNLFLQQNQFSGEIPGGFFQLNNLLRVNLAVNHFSGGISSGFKSLTKLRTLSLEENQLTGSISELNSLNGLREFNISSNRLNGSIPSNLVSFSEQSFLGNSLCGAPLDSCPNQGSENKLSGGEIAGIVIGSVVGFLLFIQILFFLCRRIRTQKANHRGLALPHPPSPVVKHPQLPKDQKINSRSLSREPETDPARDGLVFLRDSPAGIFTLEGLLRASAQVLGRGSTGTTYKVYLEGGDEVVVKRLKNVTVSERLFEEQVEHLGRVAHENVVPLMAYFYSREEKLLVYESKQPLASLHGLLYGNKGADREQLTWMIRINVALGAASAVAYIHSLGGASSHGSIKSSNILITQSYDARVTDHGLTELISSAPMTGYHAPELPDPHSNITHESDVYSFGVMLLELLTGISPSSEALAEEGINLPRWVQSVARGNKTTELLDPELLRYDDDSQEQMIKLLHLAISCTSRHPDQRPSMAEVVRHIKEISQYYI